MRVPIPDETILGLISANAQHGYQILSHFHSNERLGRVWNMSTSQVYAVLNRLEKSALIEGVLVTQDDAPAKKRYTITPAGQERLRAWLFEPAPSSSIRKVRVEFLSRLYIAKLLDMPTTEIITRQRSCIERQVRRMEIKIDSVDSGMEEMVVSFSLGQLQAALRWLDALLVEQRDEKISREGE